MSSITTDKSSPVLPTTPMESTWSLPREVNIPHECHLLFERHCLSVQGEVQEQVWLSLSQRNLTNTPHACTADKTQHLSLLWKTLHLEGPQPPSELISFVPHRPHLQRTLQRPLHQLQRLAESLESRNPNLCGSKHPFQRAIQAPYNGSEGRRAFTGIITRLTPD